jgi:hypothetical protein
MHNKKEIASTLKTVVVSMATTLTLMALLQASAWTAPASTAPAGNVSGPITTSATAQTKTGSFTSNGYVQGYTPTTGYYGLLNYSGYGGYFYGSGGVYSQNTSGYYTYLDYPGSSWGVYTNGGTYAGGTEYANDFCLNNGTKCLSAGSVDWSNVTNKPTDFSPPGTLCGLGSALCKGYDPSRGECPPGYKGASSSFGVGTDVLYIFYTCMKL